MRTLKATLLAALVASSATFTSPATFKSPAFAQTPGAAAASPPPAGVVADVPMLMRGPMPAVEVMVNGRGPFLFAIDTGAQGRARIDASLAALLKLEKVGEARASDGSGTGVRTLDVVRADTVEFGGLRFESVEAPVRDYNLRSPLPKIDGILGIGLFEEHLLRLDYPARRVRVSRGELPAADGREVIGFENPRGVPVVTLEVGGRRVKANLDTGNTIGDFVLPESLVKELALASEPVVVGRARTVSSDVEIRQARLKDTLRLGGHEFAGPTVTFPSVADVANVGSRALAAFAVTLDQKNRRLRLERGEAVSEVTAAKEAGRVTKAGAAAGGAQATKAGATAITADGTAAAAAALEEYAGVYGERTVSAEGGALHLQRRGGPKLKMVSAGKDEFALEMVAAARLKFVRGTDGRVAELHVLNREGVWEKAARQRP